MHAFLFIFLTTDFPFLDTIDQFFHSSVAYNHKRLYPHLVIILMSVPSPCPPGRVFYITEFSEKNTTVYAGHQYIASIHAEMEVPYS